MPVSQAVLYMADIPPLTELGGISLLHRAIISGKRIGIKKFFLFSPSNPEKIPVIRQDSRIGDCWEWLSHECLLEHFQTSEEKILFYSIETIFHPKALNIAVQHHTEKAQIHFTQENGVSLDIALLAKNTVAEIFLKNTEVAPKSIFSKLQELDISSQVFPGFAYPLKYSSSDNIPRSIFLGEKALLQSYFSTLDGIVDLYFNRPIGRLLTLPLVRWHIHPNGVSIIGILLGLVSAILFSNSHAYFATLLGALLLQLSAIIDCIDGDVARIQFRESTLGKWLDLTGDNIVHVAIFSSLTLREYHRFQTMTPLILGSLLVVGAIISFILVVYAQKILKTQSHSIALSGLETWIDKMTTRDFTVLLVIGAIVGELYWFLWLSGIGIQIFWTTLLGYILVAKHHK